MTQSKLRFETDSLSPFSLKVYSSTNVFENDDITILRKNFQQLLSHPLAGFQFLDDLENMADQCKNIFEQFRHKKYFVHVGMGGSVLAAEVLKDALGNNNSKVIFINNLDSDYIKNTLESISLKESLFYIVSKSGNTLETQLTMNLIISSLQNISEFSKLSKEELLKNFFVVATDDSQGPLRKMAQTYGIRSLSIPSNLGGRYCALSAVTFLPMLFLGLNLKEFIQGAKQTKQYFKDNEVAQDLLPLAKLFMEEHDSGINQTVFMPYSSYLKSLSHWFAQLWAESLGKISTKGKVVGLTPIVAHGPADQHSLLQLFTQGPKNKNYIFISIQNPHSVQEAQHPDLTKTSLHQVVRAQQSATCTTLLNQNATILDIEIKELSERCLGSLFYFFELLTVATGASLSVDPFDQPGVEVGKKLTLEILTREKYHT
jgi:glucose-6-phosphate isomerase